MPRDAGPSPFLALPFLCCRLPPGMLIGGSRFSRTQSTQHRRPHGLPVRTKWVVGLRSLSHIMTEALMRAGPCYTFRLFLKGTGCVKHGSVRQPGKTPATPSDRQPNPEQLGKVTGSANLGCGGRENLAERMGSGCPRSRFLQIRGTYWHL